MSLQKEFPEHYTIKNKGLLHRYEKTLEFMEDCVPSNSKILDIGIRNPFCELIEKKGHSVDNTAFGIDLDLEYEQVKQPDYDVVTAFEIFEHLVSPFPLLKAIEADKLVASVPLKLWFASAYWSETDPYDRHYHEFEPRQFDMLLEKAGWVIKKYEMWNPYTKGFGIRPLLRKFTPRYYIVYCERKQ